MSAVPDVAADWWETLVVEDIVASTRGWCDPLRSSTTGRGNAWARAKVIELVRRINDTWAEQGVGKIVEVRTDRLVRVVCRWCKQVMPDGPRSCGCTWKGDWYA